MIYPVIFYTGGYLRGEWRRTVPAPTREAAEALVADLERMGSPALIWEGDALPEGAPSWWDFKTLQPKRRA